MVFKIRLSLASTLQEDAVTKTRARRVGVGVDGEFRSAPGRSHQSVAGTSFPAGARGLSKPECPHPRAWPRIRARKIDTSRLLLPFLVLAFISIENRRAYGVGYLRFPQGIRSYGMGQTGVADGSDPCNAFYNPANLASVQQLFFSGGIFDPMPWRDSNELNIDAGVYTGFRFEVRNGAKMGVGGGLRYSRIDYGETFVTDDYGNILDAGNPFERIFSLSAAGQLQITDRTDIAIGTSIKPWKAGSVYVGGTSGDPFSETSAIAVDIGTKVTRRLFEDSEQKLHISAGFAYQNLGSDAEYGGGFTEKLPAIYRYGFSTKYERRIRKGENSLRSFSTSDLSLIANFDVTDFRFYYDNVYAAGFELGAYQAIFFRLGYTRDDGGLFAFGFGAGLTREKYKVRFDFARSKRGIEADAFNRFGFLLGIAI